MIWSIHHDEESGCTRDSELTSYRDNQCLCSCLYHRSIFLSVTFGVLTFRRRLQEANWLACQVHYDFREDAKFNRLHINSKTNKFIHKKTAGEVPSLVYNGSPDPFTLCVLTHFIPQTFQSISLYTTVQPTTKQITCFTLWWSTVCIDSSHMNNVAWV